MRNLKIIQTAKNSEDRLTEKESLKLADEKKYDTTISINEENKFQKIVGFGGAFTEAAAYTLTKMEEEKRKEIIKKYFHPVEGIGYSIGRVHIHSCDFALGNYTYVEKYDTELKTFDISHEKKWVIPFIKAAEEVRNDKIMLLASPWSPPEWMKTNGEMNNGGKLIEEYASVWARYYAKFIKSMKEEELDIWAITVQNEPAATQVWDSCIYSDEEERDFIKNHLGPTLEKEGLEDIKVYIWDHNRDIIVERAEKVLDDPEAAKYVYGVANHWYVSEEFENLSKVHDKYPNKHILFSEGCQEGGVHLGSWLTGERYGRNMIGDFNNWQEGWLDWNLILDETGGPNHVGNLCDAPIIADTKTQEIHYNSSYYYIGHFSKYVKPGAVRVEVKVEGNTKLQNVAFLNEDGTSVMILMNETDNSESLNLEINNKYASYTLLPHSIVTVLI
ncbi:glycoside hydrolase family 30 protein [Clostridium grantii]|uniref:Glucosylceramidase n=1 Tax=Clostridium grantii DSM 8605 TaxID=1121316 RepID=A0A1M5VZD0_9CLOT|nr:glycoside hydrolase family 30 protein [Clostridium grantii]SHH80364.1 glucosylceramidase [Clostridium grantii DSM 8605]